MSIPQRDAVRLSDQHRGTVQCLFVALLGHVPCLYQDELYLEYSKLVGMTPIYLPAHQTTDAPAGDHPPARTCIHLKKGSSYLRLI